MVIFGRNVAGKVNRETTYGVALHAGQTARDEGVCLSQIPRQRTGLRRPLKMKDPWPLMGLSRTAGTASPWRTEASRSTAGDTGPRQANGSSALQSPDGVVRTGYLDRPRRESPLRQLPVVLASTSAHADAKSRFGASVFGIVAQPAFMTKSRWSYDNLMALNAFSLVAPSGSTCD